MAFIFFMAYVAFHHIVGVIHDVPRQAKVTNLCLSVAGKEDISCCYISVNALDIKANQIQLKLEIHL